MINYNIFLKSDEWKEVKQFLLDSIVDKPIFVCTNGHTAEAIALEYKALEIAAKKVMLAIKQLEGRMTAEVNDKQIYR